MLTKAHEFKKRAEDAEKQLAVLQKENAEYKLILERIKDECEIVLAPLRTGGQQAGVQTNYPPQAKRFAKDIINHIENFKLINFK